MHCPPPFMMLSLDDWIGGIEASCVGLVTVEWICLLSLVCRVETERERERCITLITLVMEHHRQTDGHLGTLASGSSTTASSFSSFSSSKHHFCGINSALMPDYL